MKDEKTFVVVPWVNDRQRDSFLTAWGVNGRQPDWLVMQQDVGRLGCAVTKNRGIVEAMAKGADTVVILDDDCYPVDGMTLDAFAEAHEHALAPQPVEMFKAVTSPPSRGTPYSETTMIMPVAASMGFWNEIGDYCAVRQLAHQAAEMTHDPRPIHGQYFPLCGMNMALRPRQWFPWCNFIDVARFDDIWMGWLFQREAYRRGYCFNLGGPVVRHARQSNVWKNLRAEAEHLEVNETLWRDIASCASNDYTSLLRCLPVKP